MPATPGGQAVAIVVALRPRPSLRAVLASIATVAFSEQRTEQVTVTRMPRRAAVRAGSVPASPESRSASRPAAGARPPIHRSGRRGRRHRRGRAPVGVAAAGYDERTRRRGATREVRQVGDVDAVALLPRERVALRRPGRVAHVPVEARHHAAQHGRRSRVVEPQVVLVSDRDEPIPRARELAVREQCLHRGIAEPVDVARARGVDARRATCARRRRRRARGRRRSTTASGSRPARRRRRPAACRRPPACTRPTSASGRSARRC